MTVPAKRIFARRQDNLSVEESINYIRFVVLKNESKAVFGSSSMITEKSCHGLPLFFWKMALEDMGFIASFVCIKMVGYESIGLTKFQYGLHVEFPDSYKN